MLVAVTIFASCRDSCRRFGQSVRLVILTFSSSGERILVATGEFVSRVLSWVIVLVKSWLGVSSCGVGSGVETLRRIDLYGCVRWRIVRVGSRGGSVFRRLWAEKIEDCRTVCGGFRGLFIVQRVFCRVYTVCSRIVVYLYIACLIVVHVLSSRFIICMCIYCPNLSWSSHQE